MSLSSGGETVAQERLLSDAHGSADLNAQRRLSRLHHRVGEPWDGVHWSCIPKNQMGSEGVHFFHVFFHGFDAQIYM